MSADTLIVDGHAFSWKRICELRRQQLEERAKSRGAQPALFELHEDYRPSHERCAADRYRQPNLLEAVHGPVPSALPKAQSEPVQADGKS